MGTNIGYIMTLANGIIGVSILAMPFCFKQCGIILSTLMLLISSVISRFACHFLLKSAIMARRRTFEFLAFHAFGPAGKFFVEIGIIGFLLGTCIAFFVVVGDLGPAIIANILSIETPTETLRSTVIISLAIFCVLPLGLLKNVDSLSSVCTATVGFYFCLVIKIIIEALPHILFGDWISKVDLWRPAGILQCLPIFSMALFCQTQLFEIFDILPNASLESMNLVVRGAVNICTAVYIFVGVFGYIAFCSKPFSGNILMSFTPSMTTDIIKIGFVLSVAFSFPMVIFPCRASLHSLLFKKAQMTHETYVSYIPEYRFKWLTVFIVAISFITGLLIPSIELVLGLVGSTIGVMICVLFPATCFICMTTKNTNERIVAQIMLSIGILVMVLGTYANLYAMDEAASVTTLIPKIDPIVVNKPDSYLVMKQDSIQNTISEIKESDRNIPPSMLEDIKIKLEKNKISYSKNITINEVEKIKNEKKTINIVVQSQIRHEPPQPVEPEDSHVKDTIKKDILPTLNINKVNLLNENDFKEKRIKLGDSMPDKEIKHNEPELKKIIETKKEEVDQEAIKKEDREIAEETKVEQSTVNAAQELFEKLKAQGQEQEKVLQEAKQVLAEIKEQKEELERKQQIGELEKKKAALEIQKIANIAIESLSKKDNNLNTNVLNVNEEQNLEEAHPESEVKTNNENFATEVKQYQSPVAKLLLETHNLKNKTNNQILTDDTSIVQNRTILMKPIPLAKNDKNIHTKDIQKTIETNNVISSNKETSDVKPKEPTLINEEKANKIELEDSKLRQFEIKKIPIILNNQDNEIKANLIIESKHPENLPQRDILSQDTTLNTNENRIKRDIHTNNQYDVCEDINHNIETDLLKESK